MRRGFFGCCFVAFFLFCSTSVYAGLSFCNSTGQSLFVAINWFDGNQWVTDAGRDKEIAQ
jgi:hypothetical protein